MKKRLVLCALLAILVSILAKGTLAYFTDVGTARNVITTGKIRVEIVEQQKTESGELVDYTDPIRIMPGTTVSKIVTVRAEEEAAEAWIRMKPQVQVADAAGKVMPHTAQELAAIISLNVDAENWTEKDGWYYYASAISDGAQTLPLFEEVAFSGPNMDNRYQNTTVTVTVKAQAVQKANNGTSALDAQGWPAE